MLVYTISTNFIPEGLLQHSQEFETKQAELPLQLRAAVIDAAAHLPLHCQTSSTSKMCMITSCTACLGLQSSAQGNQAQHTQ